MQLGRVDVQDPLLAVQRSAAGLLDNEGERIRFIE